ncbi:MAG: NrdH-redoxin [Parcubacteria group bacterium SW_4_46_8]|nr:MAG: NrdH-redoxin [Parcubacteria group bacterium SW_4_46_8]
MANKVEIYTTPSCEFCKQAKEYMKENEINYKDYDVKESAEKRQEMIEISGQMSVPVIVVDEDMMVGFDAEKLEEMVKENFN